MNTWVDQVNARALILIDQVLAARSLAKESGHDLEWLEKQYRGLLEQLYAEEYAAAKLRDSSDLVLRAEGPGADHYSPSLQSFSWLSEHVRVQLRKLTEAVLPLSVLDSKKIAKRMGWTFTGYAPGSIMVGYALQTPPPIGGFEDADSAAFDLIRNAAQSIASIPQFVGDDDLDQGLSERIPDPAMRDAAMVAAWSLSPTPQSGIHTVQIAARDGDHGSLSQRERMVLKKSIASPLFRQNQTGSFVGRLRAADLDKHRVILRSVDSVGSIRCVISESMALDARKLFGEGVRVFGTYEADRSGRPRLMRVDRIEAANLPKNLELSDES